MKCVVTGGNVKGKFGPAWRWASELPRGSSLNVSALLPTVLGKAVHSLSRIGDELYLEPLDDGVRDWEWGRAASSWEPGAWTNQSLAGAGQDDCRQIRLRNLSFLPGCWGISLDPCVDRAYLPSLEQPVAVRG